MGATPSSGDRRSAGGPRYGLEVEKDLYRACMKARRYSFVEGGDWVGLRD